MTTYDFVLHLLGLRCSELLDLTISMLGIFLAEDVSTKVQSLCSLLVDGPVDLDRLCGIYNGQQDCMIRIMSDTYHKFCTHQTVT